MGFFHHDHENEKAKTEVYETDGHKGHWSHQLIGGAAAAAALHQYNNKKEKDGKPVKYGLAKELAAGVAVAEVEKLFETKGLNFIDKQKAKAHAKKEAERAIATEYPDDPEAQAYRD